MIDAILTLLIVCFPGILILFFQNVSPAHTPIEKLPMAVAYSFVWWIIGFWFLRLIPIPLDIFVYMTLVLSGAASVYFLSRRTVKRKPKQAPVRTHVFTVLFFALLAFPIIYITAHTIAPSGQDASMHAYLAARIADENGFPKTMKPVVPVDRFGFYPIGLPIIVAVMMKLNHLPVYTNMLIVTALTYWLYAALFYTLLRQQFSMFISATVTIIVSWVLSEPYDIISWGAIPTVLSFDLLLLVCSFIFQKRHAPFDIILIVLLWYVAFTIHYMLPVASIYVALCLLPFYRKAIPELLQSVKPAWILFLVIVCIPFLWHIKDYPFHVSKTVDAYVATLQHDDLLVKTGAPVWAIAIAAATYMRTHIPYMLLLVYGCSLGILIVINRRHVAMYIVSLLCLFLLIVNSRYWLIPLSTLLYPDRIILLGALPVGIGIAEALSAFAAYVYRTVIIHTRRNYILIQCVILVFLAHIFIPTIRITYRKWRTSLSLSVVTRQDIRALTWLATHTTPTDIVMNNYYDAGIWIPAIAGRPITFYHSNPIDMDELASHTLHPNFAYIGQQSLTQNGNDPVQEYLRTHRNSYTLLYSEDKVRIYKLQQTN